MEDCALPVANLRFPVNAATKPIDRLEELLDMSCPVLDPFRLSANRKDTAGSFPFERSNFVGAHTFGKPDGSGSRDIFAKAVV